LKKRYNNLIVRRTYPTVPGYNIYKDMALLPKDDFVKWGERTLPRFLEQHEIDHPFNNKVYLIRKNKKRGFLKGNMEWFSVNGIRSVAEKTLGKPVQCFSPRGKLIKRYHSITRGAEENDILFWTVASCCVGLRKKDEKNHIWKFESDPDFPQYMGKKYLRIIQKKESGRVVKIWENAKAIVKTTGFKQCNISMCLNHHQKTSNGYLWEYER